MAKFKFAASSVLSIAGLTLAGAAIAQPTVTPRVIQGTPSAVHTIPANPPSNMELQLELNQLAERVDLLSNEISALKQTLNDMKTMLADFRHVDDERYRRMRASMLATCKLLYQHHWAPNGAQPTPGNPYVPDTYCGSGVDSVPMPY